jgi:hypothetical protein
VDIELDVGDILIDSISNETGLLLRRFNIFEHTKNPIYPPLSAWEIIWSGTNVSKTPGRYQTYTEEGLINIIAEGALVLLKVSGD